MNVLRIALVLGFMTTPAVAQDAASSSMASQASQPPEPSSSAPQTPPGLSDGELEMAVRAAYSAAAAFAAAHGNYFARDGVFGPLHDAVAAASAAAYPAVVVPADIAADLDAAKVCLAAPGTELRVASNTYGDGITLVAVTDRRVFAYEYDPHKSSDIKVLAAADCMTTK